MKLTALLIGVFLILGGIAYFATNGFSYQTQEKVLDIGPVEAYAQQEKHLPVSPLLGYAIIGGGLVLVVGGAVSKAS